MEKRVYRYIYGPVSSWRLGSSLGVDPISAKKKICNFDCMYCQLGRTRKFNRERREFVPLENVMEEIKSIKPATLIDYITFSGAGEPTLASNLGEMIYAVKQIRNEKTAVITNSSLMIRKDVKEDLSIADYVLAKLDACDSDLFQQINRPMKGIDFERMVNALKDFSSFYNGRFALQVMFTGMNGQHAERTAKLANEIRPDEVQINTPLRPCNAEALSRTDIAAIENCFRTVCRKEITIVSVYKTKKKKVIPLSEPDTLRRRGKKFHEEVMGVGDFI